MVKYEKPTLYMLYGLYKHQKAKATYTSVNKVEHSL